MRRATILLLLLAAAGCSDELNRPPETPKIVVSVSASQTRFSSDDPTVLTVTVVNQSQSPVSFGYGSGSCWLGYVALHLGVQTNLGSGRPCTTDVMVQTLEAGESRTEEFYVDGVLTDRYPYETIAAGVYEIRGRIDDYLSEPVLVEYYDPVGL